MKIIPTRLPDLRVIEPQIAKDERGFFLEAWHQQKYGEARVASRMVQDNVSHSKKSVLRGMHFQNPSTQAKLIFTAQGEIYDVCVDLRRGSPTFGEWEGVYLNVENKRQLFVPEGFAHGFCVTSDSATVVYKCSNFYHPPSEWTLLWNDPDIGIEWPIHTPLLSEKDLKGLRLKNLPEKSLFNYKKPPAVLEREKTLEANF